MKHRIDKEYLSAEYIAQNLDRGHRVGAGRYVACCPAHDDKTPSFSITQYQNRVLVHCFAGCSQSQVIDALRRKGLWRNPLPQPGRKLGLPPLSQGDLDYMACFTLMYRSTLKNNEEPSLNDTRLYYAIADRLTQAGVEL